MNFAIILLDAYLKINKSHPKCHNSEKKMNQNKDQKKNLGIAFFDNQYDGSSPGTAFKNGGNFRFNHINDLDSDTLWVTNIGFQEFKKQKLYLKPNLQNDTFLGRPLPSIYSWLGLENSSNIKKGKCLENIAVNVDEYLSHYYGINLEDQKFSLTYAFKDSLFPKEYNDRADASRNYNLYSAARDSYVALQYPTATPKKEIITTYQLSLNKYLNALFNLTYPEYNATWKLIKNDNAVQLDETKLKEVLDGYEHGFVEVSIRNVNPSVSKFAPFSRAKIGYRKQSIRKWCSIPEALLYSHFGQVDVKQAYVTNNTSKLNLNFAPLPEKVSHSLSSEIISYCLLSAISPFTQQPPSYIDVISSYISMYDRLYLFKLAKVLYEKGFEVLNFGRGKITLGFSTKDQESEAEEIVKNYNMCKRLNDL